MRMKRKLALRISINGRYLCTASYSGLDVLSAAVDLATYRRKAGGEDFRLQVRGMSGLHSEPYHWKWLDRKLKVGEEITIRFVETQKTSLPKRKYRAK